MCARRRLARTTALGHRPATSCAVRGSAFAANDISGRGGDRQAMRRREFITLLGGTVLSPFTAHAQQNLPTIGFLNSTSAEKYAPYIASFYAGKRADLLKAKTSQ